MLTPVFHLSQNDKYIIIEIRAPYAKITDTEIDVDGKQFIFYSKPYYLRLNFCGEILEDESANSAKYDVDKGLFMVRVEKATHGEVFEDLDMLTKLLTPPGSRTVQQGLLVEVLNDDGSSETTADGPVTHEEDQIDWFVPQTPESDQQQILLNKPTYGFGNSKSAVFTKLQDEFLGVVDLIDPDNTPTVERRSLRETEENLKFDEDHYLADYFQTEAIDELLQFTPVDTADKNCNKFTDSEEEQLRHLPRKEYILDDITTVHMLLALVDILFAYAYNHRTTEGENSVESSWTICKLSSTLSWFGVFASVREVIVASVRRSLCFPLHRNWALSTAVLNDVKNILDSGRVSVLKCLLEIRTVLVDSDLRYILNDLYITDFCVWLQSVSESKIAQLSCEVHSVDIGKDDVRFELNILEQAGRLALTESDKSDTHDPTHLTDAMVGLAIKEVDSDSSSSSDYSSDKDSSDDSDSDESTPDPSVEAVIQAALNLEPAISCSTEGENRIKLVEEL